MAPSRTIVLASSNSGKIREIARLLEPLDVSIVPQSELGVSDAEETGSTFEENAIIEARHASAATGLPAIADDSGLAVDALGGEPGVYSARYAGAHGDDEANNDKLLSKLSGVADEERGAAFHCVACYLETADSSPVIAHGEWRGRILHNRRGSGGFGYDPLFLDPESGKASAELAPEEKNARSHRGQALRELARLLGAP